MLEGHKNPSSCSLTLVWENLLLYHQAQLHHYKSIDFIYHTKPLTKSFFKMFGFGEAKEHRDAVYEGQHEGKLSHEIVAGGAAFEAMKLFEDRQRKNGEPVKHQFAKEMIAGIAGAEVDKLFETKGLDYIDREKAKRHAEKQAEHLYQEQYGDMDEYNPERRGRHERMDY